ncbi:leucine zipper protein 4 [Sagmatias obliquidens]|uniref:leucine zipper protein 4 n=1 Tax=Sagmatias obliquidens TaxID=3371155 RepID=UPI000F43F840|nr:leucine zipper protein 4 [Lagenorhynchus obliquidens]
MKGPRVDISPSLELYEEPEPWYQQRLLVPICLLGESRQIWRLQIISHSAIRAPAVVLDRQREKLRQVRGLKGLWDDIIILRKIGMDTEEIKNETQNDKKNTSVSRQQSNADKHHQQRGYSRFINNVEERNDEKPNGETFGFKSGQSSLNRQPSKKQEKCNENSKAQAVMNQGQSERNQHQSEGSQGQSEENQHYSERSRGHSKRSHGQAERSHRQSERSHGQAESSHRQSERSRSQSERSHRQSERSRGQKERSHHQSERSHGQLERSHRQSERSHGQRDLVVNQKDLVVNQKDLLVNQKELMANQRDLVVDQKDLVVDQQDLMADRRDFIGQSERSHDQSRRYKRYSSVEIEFNSITTYVNGKAKKAQLNDFGLNHKEMEKEPFT